MTGAALLLRDFVNTLDLECGLDDFTTPARLACWLRERGLLAESVAAGAEDLRMAITLREGLRVALLNHHGPMAASASTAAAGSGSATAPDTESTLGTDSAGRPGALPPELEDSLARLPLRVSLASSRPTLVAAATGTAGGLGRIAAAIMQCAADGTWERLKACQEDTCQWAFLDTSKNRSRAWCSMRVCGNRTKTRAYRARRRATSAGDV